MSKNEDFLAEVEALKSKRLNAKKKINSKRKGNGSERDFVNLLNERFTPHKFIRTPQSGAIMGGQNFAKNSGLEQHIVEALSSDIIVPKLFKMALEHKAYNQDSIRIGHLLRDNETDDIKDWWKQVCTDASKSGKIPMLVVKLDNAERFCVFQYDVVKAHISKFNNLVIWKNKNENLVLVRLKEIFELPDDFFFNK
jgi:hypothetical protein